MTFRGRVLVSSVLFVPAILLHTGGIPGNAQGERPTSFRTGNPVRNPHGKLVFMLTTGFEDLTEVRLCLEDVKAAKLSGYLEDVIWVVRGRGVDVLGASQGILTRPPEIIRLAREVKTSGVHIIAAMDSLKQQHVSVATLDPKPTDIVENSAALVGDLVSQGYQVIRY